MLEYFKGGLEAGIESERCYCGLAGMSRSTSRSTSRVE